MFLLVFSMRIEIHVSDQVVVSVAQSGGVSPTIGTLGLDNHLAPIS